MITKNEKQVIINLGFNESHISTLNEYLKLLWQSNEELNLISRKMTREDLINNHVIDCLLPLKYFPEDIKRVADLGTGGGLPAIIYAIYFKNCEFSLYEKSPLKQSFLNSCKKITPNIVVKAEVTSSLNGVEIVTARGFKPIDVILQMTSDYYTSGGRYFLLKGRLEKINEEISLALKKNKNLKPQVDRLHSPVLEVERHLVRIN